MQSLPDRVRLPGVTYDAVHEEVLQTEAQRACAGPSPGTACASMQIETKAAPMSEIDFSNDILYYDIMIFGARELISTEQKISLADEDEKGLLLPKRVFPKSRNGKRLFPTFLISNVFCFYVNTTAKRAPSTEHALRHAHRKMRDARMRLCNLSLPNDSEGRGGGQRLT